MNDKGQQVIFGTMLMIFIFFLVFTLLLDDIFINPQVAEERYQHLRQEAARASETLLLPGYPEDWDEHTIQRAGLATNSTYDHDKALLLRTIAENDYGRSKELIGVRHDYLITITTQPPTTIGEPGIPGIEALAASEPRYVAKQERTMIDKETGRPITITTHVYRHAP